MENDVFLDMVSSYEIINFYVNVDIVKFNVVDSVYYDIVPEGENHGEMNRTESDTGSSSWVAILFI